jgi:prepilin-type processing-associated H-X9-DG protein
MPRILAFVDQAPLYNRINWEIEPGTSGTGNTQVRNTVVPIYRCPSDGGRESNAGYKGTNYVTCIGNQDDAFSKSAQLGGVLFINSDTGLRDIKDGTSNTMIVAECKVNSPWIKRSEGDTSGYTNCQVGTAPDITSNVGTVGRGYSWFMAVYNQSFTYSTRLRPNDRPTSNHECELWSSPGVFGARSEHTGGVQVLMADGAVRFIGDSIDLNTWRALGSRSGGEVVGEF